MLFLYGFPKFILSVLMILYCYISYFPHLLEKVNFMKQNSDKILIKQIQIFIVLYDYLIEITRRSSDPML